MAEEQTETDWFERGKRSMTLGVLYRNEILPVVAVLLKLPSFLGKSVGYVKHPW